MKPSYFRFLAVPVFIVTLPAQAVDLSKQLSINGILAATGQCQSVSARLPSEGDGMPLDGFDNECRGGMPIQFEISYRPSDAHEFFAKVGFAADNGLNQVSPWNLAPWAADLEDDLENINGRNRDYLLTAWYKYTHAFGDGNTLGASIGIIDSTDYIDGNQYANDEFTQFMNEVFVNSGSYNLGSYDTGAALELGYGDWRLTGLGMNIGENDDGSNYNFWGLEIGYHPETAMGEGNYRFTLTGTSSEFLDPAGKKQERLLGYGLSFDQAFGEVVGAFLRVSRQQDDAAVDYKSLYSGGFNLDGSGWNRDDDNIGIGYAYLDGGNQSIDQSQVFEAYYRAVLNEHTAITADVQYMKDELLKTDPRQDDPKGWIFGMRLTAEF
ncbi:carbohydrate porin [Candidatus Thiosymbion oneisti]|uniref:carbohydrate porin n=1 Tax=Candidatus Thiosymbion oneisti TaxID=589554 RepID=UPI0010606F1E|nr:carbohydrate porin [Candidatus Thiosymbion oneisti]